jgi:hypothetical protein
MKFLKLLLLGFGLVGWNGANALLITPGDCDDYGGSLECLTGSQTNTGNTQVVGSILWEIDQTYPDLTEYFKQNVGDAPDGVLAGAYDLTFSNTSTDPMDATITATGLEHVDCAADGGECFVLVKDGASIPAWYFFNLTDNWDGLNTLYLEDFWPNNGSISHVSLFARTTSSPARVPPESVPEPAASLIFGVGLLMIGLVRRKV